MAPQGRAHGTMPLFLAPLVLGSESARARREAPGIAAQPAGDCYGPKPGCRRHLLVEEETTCPEIPRQGPREKGHWSQGIQMTVQLI